MTLVLWLIGAGAVAIAVGLVFVGLEVRKLRVAVMANAEASLGVAKNIGATPVGEAIRAVTREKPGKVYAI